MGLDPVVKKENLYMLAGCGVCTIILQFLFVAFGRYDYTVLLGGLWGCFIAVLNFFLMSLAVQRAVSSGDEASAKLKIQASYTKRMLVMIALMAVGILLPVMHWCPVLAAVFYPRVVILARGMIQSFRQRRTHSNAAEETDKGAKPSSNESAHSFSEEDAEDESEDEMERLVGFFGAKAVSKAASRQASRLKMTSPLSGTAEKKDDPLAENGEKNGATDENGSDGQPGGDDKGKSGG